MAQPTQSDPQFKLRLPAALKERVQSAAADNNRSMNAEIVATLEEKFPAPPPSAEIEALIELAMNLIPKQVLKEFIINTMEKEGVTEQDIRDGLVPGVVLEDPNTDAPSSDD